LQDYKNKEKRKHLLNLLQYFYRDFPFPQGTSPEDILELETQLASISLSNTELRDPTRYRRIRKNALYFPQQILEEKLADERPIVNSVPFFKKLPAVLRSFDPMVVQAYFISGQLQNALLSYAYAPLHQFKELVYFRGRPKAPKFCVSELESILPDITSHVQLLTYEKDFLLDLRSSVTELADQIRAKYASLLSKSSWLSRPMKSKMLKKIEGIKVAAVANDWSLDPVAFHATLSKYNYIQQISPTGYFKSKMRLISSKLTQEVDLLYSETDRSCRYVPFSALFYFKYRFSRNEENP
jgi:predicted metalloendopeptidase